MKLRALLVGVVARAAYPVLLVGSVAVALAAHARGAPAVLASSGAFLAVLGATLLLERAMPHEPRWSPSPEEARQDLGYLALASVLQGVGKAAGASLAAALSLSFLALSGAAVTPSSWPLAARVAVALGLADLGKYALHRLAHERPWWWRFHAEHHAPPRMHALNATRLHPLNLLWNLTLDAALPALLALDLESTLALAVLRGTVAVLQHANVRLVLGPLNYLFSTPALHQWHHSAALREANANYGSTLSLWDLLFRTFALPARPRPEALGLADSAPHPTEFTHQLVWPWCASRADTCRVVRGWRARTAAAA